MSQASEGHPQRPLQAGMDVLDDAGNPAGVVGLLVSAAHSGSVIVVTHASAGTLRRGPRIGSTDFPLRLAGDVADDPPPPFSAVRSLETKSICSLIGLFPVPSGVAVAATVPGLKGLGDVQAPLAVVRALRIPLRLVVGETSSDWRIKTLGATTVFAGEDGVDEVYSDAVICEPMDASCDVMGLGGAVFFTPNGHPVGVLVGSRDGHAVMAPLRPVMWRAGFDVLDDATAAVFNGDVLPEQSVRISDVRPSAEARALVFEDDADDPSLPHTRSRSYRFALLSLRSAPSASELEGLDDLAALLPRSLARKGLGSFRTHLRRWLLLSARRHADAKTETDLANAFAPLVLTQPERPAREVMAALACLDEFKTIQVAEIAARYLRSTVTRLDIRVRTTLWWLVHDYLARRTPAEIPFEVSLTLYRSASVRLEVDAAALRQEPNYGELELEFFAMIEAALALPVSMERISLMHTTMLRLRDHAPKWAAFCAARGVIQAVRDAGGVHVADVLHEHAAFVSEIRMYERGLLPSRPTLQSRFDDRLRYLFASMDMTRSEEAAAFAELAAIGVRFLHLHRPEDEYFEDLAEKTRNAFSGLRKAA
jgi:hypothetical protein